ncbi:MAG: Adaptor for signal transduction [Alectoria sarmentosa]|nr:MAG: Adaptor for signal transduction [Alectoria sarmentosa]
MAIPPTYHDSDADDEYERSVMTSPLLATDDDASPTDSDPPSTEPTPTTFGHNIDLGKLSPGNTIVGWTTEQCADYISSLGLPQYCDKFLENEIVGEALIALRHEELKEMAIISVGHRLMILKGVYDVKIKQDITIDSDHWIPPSADAMAQDQTATRDDISRIIKSIEIRDHRIQAAEAELRKITDEYRRLRDELLPIFRMAKDYSQPLPYHPNNNINNNNHSPNHHEDGMSPMVSQLPPEQKIGSSLSRKFSTKRLFLGGTPKSSSPTHIPQSIPEGRQADASLDPSAAAVAASNHLTTTAMGGSQASTSPSQVNIPSPTSPNTYVNQPTLHQRTYRDQQPSSGSSRTIYSHAEDPQGYSSSATTFTSDRDRDRSNPTPTPGSQRNRGPPPEQYQQAQQQRQQQQQQQQQIQDELPSSGGNNREPGVEIFKSFRVSMEDPCEKVLPAALKKYNINADWKNYALYIVYGDQERCLGLKEKPLILFKQLDKEGRKPMFMLRRHAAPLEGHSGPTGSGGGQGVGMGGGGGGGYDAGGLGNGRGHQSSIQLPGGVL